MNIGFEGKEIRQGNSFEYLGRTVTGDCKSEAEMWRIQLGVNAWRRVEGALTDKDIREIEREDSDVGCNTSLPL